MRHCLLDTCGKELERKPKEGEANFNKRKFCGVKCSLEYFRRSGHWRDYSNKGVK
jgi:hypothetical protein